MTTTSRIPDLQKVNEHVWDLAEIVHPKPEGQSYFTWLSRICERYSIPRPIGNRSLEFDWVMILWTSLCNTEQAKCNKLRQLYNDANHVVSDEGQEE
jgi:hypothetical protein